MKLSQEVLTALSGAEVSGNTLRLVGQLDRKLYAKVNDALVALGGSWNRKAKAHLFEGDAADRIDEAVLSGSVERGQDFGCFFTPPDLADRVAEEAGLFVGAHVLEPSAGHGALIRAALRVRSSLKIECVELLDRNLLELCKPDLLAMIDGGSITPLHGDFLLVERLGLAPFDRVVMNPPFAKRQDIAHVRHAFGFLRPGGKLVSVMSAGVEFRSDRLTTEFRSFVEQNDGAIERLPSGSFKASGTNVETVLVTMTKGAA